MRDIATWKGTVPFSLRENRDSPPAAGESWHHPEHGRVGLPGKLAVTRGRRQSSLDAMGSGGQSHFRLRENWDSPRWVAATAQFNRRQARMPVYGVGTALPSHALALSQRENEPGFATFGRRTSTCRRADGPLLGSVAWLQHIVSRARWHKPFFFLSRHVGKYTYLPYSVNGVFGPLGGMMNAE
jgi:hypothetical protein